MIIWFLFYEFSVGKSLVFFFFFSHCWCNLVVNSRLRNFFICALCQTEFEYSYHSLVIYKTLFFLLKKDFKWKELSFISISYSTSCAVYPFWITKLILLDTTSIKLEDSTLLCMIHWTLCKKLTSYGARKSKVSTTNDMKTYLLTQHDFYHFAWNNLRVACPSTKTTSHKLGDSNQVLTNMFISYQPIHQNICWPMCHSSSHIFSPAYIYI